MFVKPFFANVSVQCYNAYENLLVDFFKNCKQSGHYLFPLQSKLFFFFYYSIQKKVKLKKKIIKWLFFLKDSPYNDSNAEGASRGPAQRRLERLFNQQDGTSVESGSRARNRPAAQPQQKSRDYAVTREKDSCLDSRF